MHSPNEKFRNRERAEAGMRAQGQPFRFRDRAAQALTAIELGLLADALEASHTRLVEVQEFAEQLCAKLADVQGFIEQFRARLGQHSEG